MDQGSLPPPMAALQMMMGHWVSQVLATIAELGVADQIAKGVHDSTELARLCEAHPDALFRVLRAGATVGILQQTGARTFALTPVGDCLRSDSPFAMRDFITLTTTGSRPSSQYGPGQPLTALCRYGASVAESGRPGS